MPSLTNEQIIGALMATVLPLVISVVQRPTWSNQARTLAAFALTLLFVAVTQVAFIATRDTPNTWQSWLQYLLFCVALTATSYVAYWKPSGVAEMVEAATSPTATLAERTAVVKTRSSSIRKTKPPAPPAPPEV